MSIATTDAEAIQSADPGRFELVFERHFDAVHRYLARRVGADRADDLAAETFATAFRSRARYDAARPDAGPWLYGIASNLLRHERRREERQLRAYARTGIDPVGGGEPSDPVAGRALAATLAALKPADRETLLLFAWADLSYDDIAAALEVPVGTVRSRLNRARAALREALAPAGVLPAGQEVLDG